MCLSQLRTTDGQLGLGLIILLLQHGHICTAGVADVSTSTPTSILGTTVSSIAFGALQLNINLQADTIFCSIAWNRMCNNQAEANAQTVQ